MTALKEGDSFPEGVVFSYVPVPLHPNPHIPDTSCLLTTPPSYVPYTEESAGITSCGIPQNYNASKEWADKKVVLFAVPGQSRSPNWDSTIRPWKLNIWGAVDQAHSHPAAR